MTGLTWQARGGGARPVFYGVDDLRFVQPVLIDDTLQVELKVTPSRRPIWPVPSTASPSALKSLIRTSQSCCRPTCWRCCDVFCAGHPYSGH
jgi:3-hydroxymyristoyl/3-hydroxydecanoyl-(acyl carrier protein) dehydratase